MDRVIRARYAIALIFYGFGMTYFYPSINYGLSESMQVAALIVTSLGGFGLIWLNSNIESNKAPQ
jgi:hypothetical protein